MDARKADMFVILGECLYHGGQDDDDTDRVREELPGLDESSAQIRFRQVVEYLGGKRRSDGRTYYHRMDLRLMLGSRVVVESIMVHETYREKKLEVVQPGRGWIPESECLDQRNTRKLKSGHVVTRSLKSTFWRW